MKVLILSTWFPYPPIHGAKIRAYHLLKALTTEHEVALLSFQDTPLETEWLETVETLCSSVEIIARKPFTQPVWGRLLGWFSIQPRSMAGNWSREFAERSRAVVDDWKPDAVIAHNFISARYAAKLDVPVKVIDAENLLAIMLYEEYLESAGRAQRARRRLAFRKMKRFEADLYPHFDVVLVTSNLDQERIQEYVPLGNSVVEMVANGVDLDYFQPGRYNRKPDQIVFNGALSYQPNYEAMDFFLENTYPIIKSQLPNTKLVITGSTKGVKTEKLALQDGVSFSGFVPDIREVLSRSSVSVVPLLSGGGTRLKVLEAMHLVCPS